MDEKVERMPEEGCVKLPRTRKARTRQSLLDRFVETLADTGDRICETPPESRYFEEMQRLLCRGDVSAVPRYAPYYHYVFTAETSPSSTATEGETTLMAFRTNTSKRR